MDSRSVSSTSGVRLQPAADTILNSHQSKPIESMNMTTSELLHKKKNELSISESTVQDIINRANKALQGIETRLEYSVHHKTGDIMVKVFNKETDEIIREIPSEKFLDLISKLQELSAGVIIDEKR